MKVLSIAYRNKEITRSRITHPLVLVGRSPLCDVLLRAPGIGSVQFIMEWIGEGEFSVESSFRDEWVITESLDLKNENEKAAKKNVKGQGFVFHGSPLKIDDYTFSWVEDRLVEADLSRNIISQQLSESDDISNQPKGNIPCVLELISLSGDLGSVIDVQHFSFLQPRQWNNAVLNQFSAYPKIDNNARSVHLKIPNQVKTQLIQQGQPQEKKDLKEVSLFLHDVLHAQFNNQEYYFRVVPKVIGPASRRSLWSDPFYIISVFFILLGLFGLLLIFRNVKNESQTIVVPPRIAKIEIIEVKPPPPPPPPVEKLKSETLPPEKEVPLPEPEEVPEKKIVKEDKKDQNGMIKYADQEATQKPAPKVSVQIADKNSKKDNSTLRVVDKNKGGLDIPTEKAPVNKSGLLSVLKKNKNIGMVKADQIIENGLVNDTVNGDKGNFVLQQSASGIVNNKHQKAGDTLAAASTKVNMKDSIGSGSINADRGNVLKEGFKANYGVSGEGGLSGTGEFTNILEAQVEGGLDRASVQSAIRGYKSEIRTCYERALQLKSGVGGRVSYKFQIRAAGSVDWINIYKNDIESNSLVSCVESILKKIMFPKAKNGQNTIVIYPFQFERKGIGSKK